MVLPYLGIPVGRRADPEDLNNPISIQSSIKSELIQWLKFIQYELAKADIVHRDINFNNIIYDSTHNKFHLIDYSWASIGKPPLEGTEDYKKSANFCMTDDYSAFRFLLSKLSE